METQNISDAEAEKEFTEKRKTGAYQEVFKEVLAGANKKISGLTRGQIAACYRAAKEAKIRYRTNYKEGYIVLSPPIDE